MKIKSYEMPHLNGQGQMTTQVVHLQPATGEVNVRQAHPVELNSTTSDIWHGINYAWETLPYTRETLEQIDQGLISRICAGHGIEWDGRNFIGLLSIDAANAAMELEKLLEGDDLGQQYAIWSAEDWYQNYEGPQLDLTVEEEVKATAPDDEIDGCMVIVDGAEEYLENLRS